MSAGFSPFDTKFKGILDRVGKLENNVVKDVALLNSEGEAYTHSIFVFGVTNRSS